MRESIRQLGNLTTRRSENVADGGSSISPRLFVLFALELLLMGVVVWYYLVNKNSFPYSPASIADIFWGLIAIATTGWGSWYLTMAHRATLRWNVSHSRQLLMIVVASGAILLGILLLNIASVFVNEPVYMDIRSQFVSLGGDTRAATDSALVGDAANGKKWFGMSCITCHGPTGDGVANAAPSLRASEFIKTADDLAIASLIRNGRAANDPANKTGKVMPAKGGNPFLDESKIADLVALLNDLEGQFGAGSTDSGTSTVSTDFSNLSRAPTSESTAIVRKWKFVDLASLDITPSEESVAIGMHAFVKANCNKCHMAAVGGQELGPTLDQIVRKYPREKLLQHMVEPSAEINEKFQAHRFLLMDGRMVSGVLVSESDEKIELMTDLLKPDQLETISIDDIDDQVKSEVSAMPDGLLDILTANEIAGLVAYVDAVGNQMAASNAPQLNRWVVPMATAETAPSIWATSGPSTSATFSSSMLNRDSTRYASVFSWLFVTATSVLAVHFLWVIGLGSAVIMHQELQLSSSIQVQLGKQMILFWSIGIAWLVIWFVLFFLIG